MQRTEALVAVLVVLSLTPLFPAHADVTMTVLNQTYHVWGHVSQLENSEDQALPTHGCRQISCSPVPTGT